MNTVIYIRVSSTLQLEGDGPERQEFQCRQFAVHKGWSVSKVFTDDVSGTAGLEERPQFQAMMEYCIENDISTILVEKADRWARDLLVGEMLLQSCRGEEITVLDCSTGFDMTETSDNPSVVFIRQVMLAAAEFNKNVFVSNSRKARRRIAERTGKCEGRKGYFDSPNYEHGELLKHMLQQTAHLSERKAADALNHAGVPTFQGKQWIHSSVRSARRQMEKA